MKPEEIAKHIGLAKVIAREFIRRRPGAAHLAEDIESVAVLALFEHAHKWNPTRGAFSTFVAPWIRQAMQVFWAYSGPVKRRSKKCAYEPTVGVSSGDEKFAPLVDAVTSNAVRTPEALAERDELADRVHAHLAKIGELRAEFFASWLGGESHAAVGKRLGYSRQWVQIVVDQERKALAEAA